MQKKFKQIFFSNFKNFQKWKNEKWKKKKNKEKNKEKKPHQGFAQYMQNPQKAGSSKIRSTGAVSGVNRPSLPYTHVGT